MANPYLIVTEDGREIGTIRPEIAQLAIAGTPVTYRARFTLLSVMPDDGFGKAGPEQTFDRIDEAWGWLRDQSGLRDPDEGRSG